MLCGEFHRAPLGLHLNLSAATRSPYTSLLALVQGMAAITAHAAHEDEDIFLGKFEFKGVRYKVFLFKLYIFLATDISCLL